jgi:predicted RNA binding protein YcfA (HicA-like mRNA interferase family)
VTRIEKLGERLKRSRGDASFDDVARLVEHHGWTKARQRGSHVVYDKQGEPPISFALVKGRRVKSVYVTDILKRLGIME